MRRVIFTAVTFLLFVSNVAGLEINGGLNRFWEKNSFILETRSEETVLWIDIPEGARVLVVVAGGNEAAKILRLKLSEPLTLRGMKEWTVTLLWDSVDVNWRCRVGGGEEPVLNKVQGYADTVRTFRWTLVTEEDMEKWRFTYPKEATFIVRQSSSGMRGVEEQDLADSPEVSLIGAGIFNIEIDPIDGGGEFIAERVR